MGRLKEFGEYAGPLKSDDYNNINSLGFRLESTLANIIQSVSDQEDRAKKRKAGSSPSGPKPKERRPEAFCIPLYNANRGTWMVQHPIVKQLEKMQKDINNTMGQALEMDLPDLVNRLKQSVTDLHFQNSNVRNQDILEMHKYIS